jgi:hypothetical protein
MMLLRCFAPATKRTLLRVEITFLEADRLRGVLLFDDGVFGQPRSRRVLQRRPPEPGIQRFLMRD